MKSTISFKIDGLKAMVAQLEEMQKELARAAKIISDAAESLKDVDVDFKFEVNGKDETDGCAPETDNSYGLCEACGQWAHFHRRDEAR